MAFTKVTSEERVLTGAEKAAILFLLLGEDTWSAIASSLTAPELEKLRDMISYVRYGSREEMIVLQETEEYGKRLGIWAESGVQDIDTSEKGVDDVKYTAGENPEEVAKLIATWIGNGETSSRTE